MAADADASGDDLTENTQEVVTAVASAAPWSGC